VSQTREGCGPKNWEGGVDVRWKRKEKKVAKVRNEEQGGSGDSAKVTVGEGGRGYSNPRRLIGSNLMGQKKRERGDLQ